MRNRITTSILLLFIFFLPVVSLFHPGLPVTHDGNDHVARIANFYQNLTEGNFIPRWAGNLNWGYGHPILEFLYPLPSYTASLAHFLGFSFIDSFKIVLGLGLVVSGITMFFWLETFLPLEASIIGAVLYVFAPYRFINVYIRGDIGENLAFVFMPLVLYFLHRYYQSKIHWFGIGISFSLACLILSHNAISLMFVPFIIFYVFYLHITSNRSFSWLFYSFVFILIGFGLAAFFWVPALVEGKYTLRNIVTKGVYKDRFVSLGRLLYGKWNYGESGQFSVQVGIIHWLVGIGSTLMFFRYPLKKSTRFLFIALFIYTFIAIVLMLTVSNIVWDRIMLLQNFQFPWRFLAIPVFTLSVLGAYVVSWISPRREHSIFMLFLFIILFVNREYWFAKAYVARADTYYTRIFPGTTDTGESAPIWSVRFMEHEPKGHLQFLTGKGTFDEIHRTSTEHVYHVSAFQPSRMLENTLYFPGWHVVVDDHQVPVEFQDQNYRGLMTFSLNQGDHTVSVYYQETNLRLISDMLSLISVLFIGGYILLERISLRRRKKYHE